jgi:mono/diheme cytochrome c family protein
MSAGFPLDGDVATAAEYQHRGVPALTARAGESHSQPMRRLMKVSMLVGVLVAGYGAPSDSARRQPAVALADDAPPPCASAPEHSLPLPSTVPPAQFVDFEKRILAFLQSGEYKRLGWCGDKGSNGSPFRDTGPFVQGVYYGTHPSVRVYYSPKAMHWLIQSREGMIPDGAMIVKEQYRPPAARYAGLREDQLPQASNWTVMIKDSTGAKDGWFWGEFFDEMTFDDDQPPFRYPWAGFGLYCVRCHATTEKEQTFAALNNIKRFPGEPIHFFDDGSWRLAQIIPDDDHGNSFPPIPPGSARPSDEDFLRTFTSIPGVSLSSVQTMPSETYDHMVAPAVGGQFISSSQCMPCHGGLNGPFGPTMFLPSPLAPPGAIAGANVSPYGEWRWSPMGLAGRDPVFYAQLDSELAYLETLPPPRNTQLTRDVRNTCLSCHGIMGKRQLDADTPGGGNFELEFLQLTDRSNPHFKYGALARDGISCGVCHRVIPDQVPPGVPPLEYFLRNSITGRFQIVAPDTIFGPFRDDEIAPYTMTNAIGITPKFNPYLRSARLCGSCHTIDLPVVDGQPGQRSLEQVTYLEWLNSQYQNEFGTPGPNAKTCQGCHMPGHYHSETKGIRVDQIVDKMAIIQDQDYPEAEHRAPESELKIRARDGFKRHEFQGLNVFLLEMFKQFNDVLGVRLDDYMSGSRTDLQDGIDNFARQAQERTATIQVSARATGPHIITAQVAVTNLAGHRFPSGVGFRRAFIELLVFENHKGRERLVWASGRTNKQGVIVDRKGEVLPTEFFTEYTDGEGRVQQRFQPHYQLITAPNQVQIYEELTKNAEGKFTTSFIRRAQTVKDNRLLPIGWTEHGPDPSLNGRFLESTHAEHVDGDPDYVNGQGTDHITYWIRLPAGVTPARTTVQATLYYQSMPPYYLNDRFKAAPNGAATQRLYYLASHLKLDRTPAESWKLKIASARTRPL